MNVGAFFFLVFLYIPRRTPKVKWHDLVLTLAECYLKGMNLIYKLPFLVEMKNSIVEKELV
jgi:hypothetical protein